MPRRFIRIASFLTVIAFLETNSPCRAQGFVEHLEPPVLEAGKTTRVIIVGSNLGKAIGLWTSLADAIKATPVGEQTSTRAVLDVAVAGQAPIGVCGVRLATVDGLANACLMLIDDLPVKKAPKADVAPARVDLPTAIWGQFREAAIDRYAIEVGAGQRVSFEAVANRLGKDVDPLITIRDAKGRIVAERDNDPGLYFDCRFEHTFAQAGTYTVEVRDARFHGSEHGYYVLRMGKFPAARVALPLAVPRTASKAELRLPELAGAAVNVNVPKLPAAGMFFGTLRRPGDDGSAWLPLESTDSSLLNQQPGDTIDDGVPVKAPGILCGVLRKPGERQFFQLDLYRGQRIQVRAEARAFNSPADLEIAITDAKGKELRRAGENPKDEIVLDFNAGNPGIYGLTVRDVNRDGGPAFAYRLELRTSFQETHPMVQATAEAEGLTLPRGTYQPLPLTFVRETPTSVGKITLELIGAPGVTLTPNVIEEGVNSVVCKLYATADAPLGIHTFQILGRPHLTALNGRQLGMSSWQLGGMIPGNSFGLFPATQSLLHAMTVQQLAPVLVRTQPLIDRQIVNVDLIPYGLREDQRRLPPALTDRFALQITEPAPFTLELPEPLVTLGRYQHVEFPIVTTRVPGFTGPITFSARGGQIAPKEEGRTRVYAELPMAKADNPRITGSIHSKILTNLSKHRVDLTAVGTLENSGRRVSLTRTFELDVRSAYTVAAEPALTKLEPGSSAKVRLTAERMKSFDGEVVVELSPSPGLNLPEKIVIPKGQSGVDLDVQAAPDCTPGRRGINLNMSAVVSGFEEEQRGRFEVEVAKPPPPKK